MGILNCGSAEDLVRMCLFEKKLTLYKEVAIFSIFRSCWYCEIMQFFGIFGMEAPEWSM